MASNAEPRERMGPADDPGWSRYPETVIEFRIEPVLRIDLRQPISADARRSLRDAGLNSTFAVITACNPRGRTVDDAENSRGSIQLRASLGARVLVGADGLSPDGTHREEGVAVAMGRDEARTLACAHGQSAFFWFDGEAMWLVGALVEAPSRRLPIVGG